MNFVEPSADVRGELLVHEAQKKTTQFAADACGNRRLATSSVRRKPSVRKDVSHRRCYVRYVARVICHVVLKFLFVRRIYAIVQEGVEPAIGVNGAQRLEQPDGAGVLKFWAYCGLRLPADLKEHLERGVGE